MTTTFFTTSGSQNFAFWSGGNGDGVYVAPGVSLTDTDSFDYAFYATSGNVTADIFGSVTCGAVGMELGDTGDGAGPGTTTVQIGSAGSVTSTGATAIAINQGSPGSGEAIANAGMIDGAQDGIYSLAPGTITNNGTIYAGVVGVENDDSVFGDIVQLNNYGTISGGQLGVYDTGSHFEEIYNSGAIAGGAGFYAIFSDSGVSEALTNYATGTVSGGVDLTGEAYVTNEGSIIGGTLLEGVASLTNSGTIDEVNFTGSATGSSFTNSGLLTQGLSANGASFAADNSGTIDGAVNLNGAGASLTDSGTIKHGVWLAGSAAGTTDVRITSTGVVTSLPVHTALQVNAGAYDIWNGGEISASGGFAWGVDVNGGGQIVNHGKIACDGYGVHNGAAAGVTAYVYNYGSIDSSQGDAINDTGGHTAVVVNYGALTGGPGSHGVYADSSTLEFLTNAGTIDAGVWLNAAGSTIDNSGTIGTSHFGAGVLLSGAGASLTDSGTINDGVVFAGGATGTSVLRITSTGLVTNILSNSGLQIAAGAYDISNAGEIQSSFGGVEMGGGGQIVNRGKIVSASGGAGVFNDAGAGATAYVYNYGSIDASQGNAVADYGGHTAVIDNYGSLTGGSGHAAVFADTGTYESLTNAGTIEGAVELGGASSTIVNTGTIDGAIALLGAGGYRFTNEGLVNGAIDFGGTGNVFNGAAGSVTGTIHGSGADGVYYGGNDGETFDMTASGAHLVVGGSGSDTFIFTAAGLTNATTVEGSGGTGTDTLEFSTSGTITASQLHHVSGIEQIDLANGTNSIALTNALVSTATNTSLTVSCGAGNDTINAGGITSAAYKLTVDADSGVDKITAGGGTDTFFYLSGSYSSGPNYDTITGANYALDKFDLNGAAVTNIDPAVTTGSLSTATFNSDLAAAIGASHLLAHAAVLFTPSGGTLAGHTFLIADTVGMAGYQANHDLVADVTGAKGPLTTGNFV